MPIYAYKCESCGHAKDVLQKMSDAPFTDCPACGAPMFKKQLTAAGFQLKGSGWYATDFKGGGAAAPGADKSEGASSVAGAPNTSETNAGESKSEAKTPAKSDAKSDAKAPAPAVSKPSDSASGKAPLA